MIGHILNYFFSLQNFHLSKMPRQPEKALDDGYASATSSNLPKVDAFMFASFFNTTKFVSPEFKNVKSLRWVIFSDSACIKVPLGLELSKWHLRLDQIRGDFVFIYLRWEACYSVFPDFFYYYSDLKSHQKRRVFGGTLCRQTKTKSAKGIKLQKFKSIFILII